MRSKSLQLLFAGAALAALVSAAIGVASQSTPSRSLLALSKRNHTLAIVDLNTLQVVARAPAGEAEPQAAVDKAQVRAMVAAGWELDTQGFSHAEQARRQPGLFSLRGPPSAVKTAVRLSVTARLKTVPLRSRKLKLTHYLKNLPVALAS